MIMLLESAFSCDISIHLSTVMLGPYPPSKSDIRRAFQNLIVEEDHLDDGFMGDPGHQNR